MKDGWWNELEDRRKPFFGIGLKFETSRFDKFEFEIGIFRFVPVVNSKLTSFKITFKTKYV